MKKAGTRSPIICILPVNLIHKDGFKHLINLFDLDGFTVKSWEKKTMIGTDVRVSYLYKIVIVALELGRVPGSS